MLIPEVRETLQDDERRLAYLALVVAQLSWSGFHIIYQEAGFDPLLFACWREVLASACMLSICYGFGTVPSWPARSSILTFVICGYCSFLNVVGSLFAIQYLGGATFSICQPLSPIITALLSCREEKMGPGRLLGMVMAVAGAIVAETQKADEASSASANTLGVVSVAVQVTAMSTLIIIQRYAMHDEGHEWSAFTLQYYLIGTAFSLLFLLLRSASSSSPSSTSANIDAPGIGALLYAGTVATALAYNCITFASRRLPSGTVTLYVCLQPLFTGILSFFVLKLSVTVGQLCGGLLVCAGLLVTVHFSPVTPVTASVYRYPTVGSVQVSTGN